MSKFENRTVKIYIWFQNLVLMERDDNDMLTGHSVLAVKDENGDQRYLSWWPTGAFGKFPADGPAAHWSMPVREPKAYGMKHKTTDIETGRTARPEKDLMGTDPKTKEFDPEKAKAHVKFRFYDAFDHAAMIKFIDALRSGAVVCSPKLSPESNPKVSYNVIHQNCSTTVAYTLRAGDAGRFNFVPFPTQIWLPLHVARYCDLLFRAIKAKKGQSGMPMAMDAEIVRGENYAAELDRRKRQVAEFEKKAQLRQGLPPDGRPLSKL